MTDVHAIIERLGELFIERFHVEVPCADTDLLETEILDSFQFVELLAALQQRFGFRVRIEDIDLDDFRTLERIARRMAANGGAAGAAALQPSSGRSAM